MLKLTSNPLVLEKTLESISFDRRHKLVENPKAEEEVKDALERLEIGKAGQLNNNY
ncbi:hypothetical protein NUSPORA_02011 [Nucleospora cyclopteri]